MDTIINLINHCREIKQGQKDFILEIDESGCGAASIGNADTEYDSARDFWSGWRTTPLEAVEELLSLLKKHDGVAPPPPDYRSDEEKRLDAMSNEEFNAYQDSLPNTYDDGTPRFKVRRISASDIVYGTISVGKMPISATIGELPEYPPIEAGNNTVTASKIGIDAVIPNDAQTVLQRSKEFVLFSPDANVRLAEWNGHSLTLRNPDGSVILEMPLSK